MEVGGHEEEAEGASGDLPVVQNDQGEMSKVTVSSSCFGGGGDAGDQGHRRNEVVPFTPFDLPEIVSSFCRYLPVEDLKNFRLVNKMINAEACQILKKKQVTRFRRIRDITAFYKLMKGDGERNLIYFQETFDLTQMNFYKMMSANEISTMNTFFLEFGPRIKCCYISLNERMSLPHDWWTILYNMPNLEELRVTIVSPFFQRPLDPEEEYGCTLFEGRDDEEEKRESFRRGIQSAMRNRPNNNARVFVPVVPQARARGRGARAALAPEMRVPNEIPRGRGPNLNLNPRQFQLEVNMGVGFEVQAVGAVGGDRPIVRPNLPPIVPIHNHVPMPLRFIGNPLDDIIDEELRERGRLPWWMAEDPDDEDVELQVVDAGIPPPAPRGPPRRRHPQREEAPPPGDELLRRVQDFTIRDNYQFDDDRRDREDETSMKSTRLERHPRPFFTQEEKILHGTLVPQLVLSKLKRLHFTMTSANHAERGTITRAMFNFIRSIVKASHGSLRSIKTSSHNTDVIMGRVILDCLRDSGLEFPRLEDLDFWVKIDESDVVFLKKLPHLGMMKVLLQNGIRRQSFHDLIASCSLQLKGLELILQPNCSLRYHLDMSCCYMPKLTRFALLGYEDELLFLRNMPSLRFLDLYSAGSGHLMEALMDQSKGLYNNVQALECLTAVNMKTIGAAAGIFLGSVNSLPNLTRLELDGCDDEQLELIYKAMPNITDLIISGTMSDVGITGIARHNCDEIVSQNAYFVVDGKDIRQHLFIGNLMKIQRLTIKSNELTDLSIIFGIAKLPNLRSLIISADKLTEISAEAMKTYMALEHLNMKGCPNVPKEALIQIAQMWGFSVFENANISSLNRRREQPEWRLLMAFEHQDYLPLPLPRYDPRYYHRAPAARLNDGGVEEMRRMRAYHRAVIRRRQRIMYQRRNNPNIQEEVEVEDYEIWRARRIEREREAGGRLDDDEEEEVRPLGVWDPFPPPRLRPAVVVQQVRVQPLQRDIAEGINVAAGVPDHIAAIFAGANINENRRRRNDEEAVDIGQFFQLVRNNEIEDGIGPGWREIIRDGGGAAAAGDRNDNPPEVDGIYDDDEVSD